MTKGKSVANKRRKFIIVFFAITIAVILEPEARKAIRMFALFSKKTQIIKLKISCTCEGITCIVNIFHRLIIE